MRFTIADVDIIVKTHQEDFVNNFHMFTLPKITSTDAFVEIYLDCVDILPNVPGELIWDDERCEIYSYIDHEIRIFKDGIIGFPYAISISLSPKLQKVLVRSDWLMQNQNSVFLFNLFSLESILMQFGRMIFHSCYIEYRNAAILFTGNSGIGKSTQGNLWQKYLDAEIINGDRSILAYNDANWYACGLPFSGTSGICKNASLPLKAIVCLGQSKECFLERINPRDAFGILWEQFTINQWNKDFIDNAITFIMQLTNDIPIYRYNCTMEKEAVDLLYKSLFKDN